MHEAKSRASADFQSIPGSASLGPFMRPPQLELLQDDVAKALNAVTRILSSSDTEITSRRFLLDAFLEFGIPVMESPIFSPWAKFMNLSGFGSLQFPSEFVDFVRTVMRLGIISAVEVGSYRGGTSYFLTAVMQRVNPKFSLVMLDLSDNLLAYERFSMILNLEKMIPCSSDELAGEPFDLVFVDGDHSFSGVMRDFENLGTVARRACAFHDIHAHEFDDQDGGTVKAWGQIKRRLHHTHEIHEFAHSETRSLGIGVAIASYE